MKRRSPIECPIEGSLSECPVVLYLRKILLLIGLPQSCRKWGGEQQRPVANGYPLKRIIHLSGGIVSHRGGKTLRKVICMLALSAFAGTLFAQSPFVGTWKFDAAKTKFTRGEPAKDVTVVIEEQGGNLQITATGTNADGSAISEKQTVPVKGGAGQEQEGPYDAVTSRAIGSNIMETTLSKGGKEVLSRRAVVSKDGKTMRVTLKGANPAGKPVAGTDAFEKQ